LTHRCGYPYYPYSPYYPCHRCSSWLAPHAAAAGPVNPCEEWREWLICPITAPEERACLAAGLRGQLVLIEEQRPDRSPRLPLTNDVPRPQRRAQLARPIVECHPTRHCTSALDGRLALVLSPAHRRLQHLNQPFSVQLPVQQVPERIHVQAKVGE